MSDTTERRRHRMRHQYRKQPNCKLCRVERRAAVKKRREVEVSAKVLTLPHGREVRVHVADGHLIVVSGFTVKRAATPALAPLGSLRIPVAKLDEFLTLLTRTQP